ncbi:VanW family protein [Enterovirga rhinocerotis]|uniref:Vancomycin resistance protein VanW n=1 Tax=Enterovirga rhinocerotis TaxID=1339210 RepID=A0A4R7BSA4_9HYPH|nr:VanW family protein [Enterovirga rhinocerotis]TDR88143.1 vancomycin resistance protein VanW [Enterovirga rhinocerotis]
MAVEAGFRGPAARPPLTTRYPWLYPLRVWQRQMLRKLRWRIGPERFALTRQPESLPSKVYRHQSKLRRAVSADPRDAAWQDNKVRNHSLAIPRLDGILIRPGETFSFWRLVGPPVARRGFVEGMELSRGRARGGIGGGLCQIGNLLHWLALHSPLEVTQRANHSFDPFPDQGRIIPYGTGAALFYNYVDLWLFNPTDRTFQIRLWLTETLLNGEIRCDGRLPHRYRIVERNAGFEQAGDRWERFNEIWRETIAKGEGGTTISTDFLYANRVRVMYQPRSEEPG